MRQHWAIENSQHWVLDVQFNEDSNRARKDYSPENLALVRRMALNVIRHNGSSKQSIRTRKLRASLNDDYRFCSDCKKWTFAWVGIVQAFWNMDSDNNKEVSYFRVWLKLVNNQEI